MNARLSFDAELELSLIHIYIQHACEIFLRHMFVFSALSNKPSHFFGVHDAAPPYWDNYIARQEILQSTVGRMQ